MLLSSVSGLAESHKLKHRARLIPATPQMDVLLLAPPESRMALKLLPRVARSCDLWRRLTATEGKPPFPLDFYLSWMSPVSPGPPRPRPPPLPPPGFPRPQVSPGFTGPP